MARKSKTNLTTDINTNLADNSIGAITPLKLRNITTDILDSILVIDEVTSVVDTDTSFAGTILEAARFGVAKVEMAAPSASTNIATNLMRYTLVNTSNGAITSTGHGVAGYDFLEISGNNTIAQSFVHESKFKKGGSGTMGTLSFYKPAIDTITGTITDFILFDADVNISGISGTITNAWLIKNPRSQYTLQTSGKIVGATGNEIPTAVHPVAAASRYYRAARWTNSGTGNFTQGLCYAGPPVIIPARTTFTKIGVNVSAAVASSTVRLGIYKMGAGGLPGDLVLDAGIANTDTTGDKEITTSVTLEAGAYHLVGQVNASGNVGYRYLTFSDAYLIELFGSPSSNPGAGTVEDIIYIVNSSTLPATFTSPTRTRVGAVMDIWLRT